MTKRWHLPAFSAMALAAALPLFTCEAVAGPETASDEAPEKPHPLAAKYPGNLVVVCEAGCPRHNGPQVVFMERAPKRKVVTQGSMQPTSARLDDAPAPGKRAVIQCLAGCYDTPKFYSSPIVSTTGGAVPKLSADDAQKRGPFSPIR
jgi:hypothetical protein